MSRVNGNGVFHYGKLILIAAPAPQSGKLVAKQPFAEDGTHYGIAIESSSGELTSDFIRLKQDVSYDWSIRLDGSDFIFEVIKDGQKVNSIRAGSMKTFGFSSTVRYPGNKLDWTVDVNSATPAK